MAGKKGGGGGSSATGRDTSGPGGTSRAGPDKDDTGRDGGSRASAGTGNSGAATSGPSGTPGHSPGAGSKTSPGSDLISSLDDGPFPGYSKSTTAPSAPTAKSYGVDDLDDLSGARPGNDTPDPTGIYDTYGQRRAAYANNPNTPNYDTNDMGVPVNMSFTDVVFGNNLGTTDEVDAALGVANLSNPVTGVAMGLTRGIQAATGMSGGASVGGYDDGNLSDRAKDIGKGEATRARSIAGANGDEVVSPGTDILDIAGDDDYSDIRLKDRRRSLAAGTEALGF